MDVFTRNSITYAISKRMGDNDMKIYKFRGWQAFKNSLTALASDREAWERQEISPLLVSLPITVVFTNTRATAYKLPYDAVAFTDVWVDQADAAAWGGIVKRITEDEAMRANTGEIAFQPAGDEIFWYNVGNEFRFFLSTDINATSATVNARVTLEYIKDPAYIQLDQVVTMDSDPISDISLTENESRQVDLVKDIGFSSRIIYRSIDEAVLMMRNDDASMEVSPREKSIDIEATQ